MEILSSWSTVKGFIDDRSASPQFVETESEYFVAAIDGYFSVCCKIKKEDPRSSDQEDFEDIYKSIGNKSPKSEVIGQLEKNDKILRGFCAFAETNSNGEAIFKIPVPSGGRFIAYGDIEFETREMGDYVKKIEISDLDRVLLPNGMSDQEFSQASGLLLYPIVGHYDERSFNMSAANKASDFKGGMSLTFKYGISESSPIGGYGYIPELMYLIIVAQKKTASAGQACQISIDWAEQNG